MFEIDGSGKRYNKGKLRYDLIPHSLNEEVAKVLSIGAEKYGEHNWEKGMQWTSVLASLKRHIAKFESGEDYDSETGLYHISHVITNAMFLLEYYNIFPQGDNRNHNYLQEKRVGYDIDDVLADFVGAYCKWNNLNEIPTNWSFYLNSQAYDVSNLPKEFWVNLPCKVDPKTIKHEPVCYITHRTCPNEWTIEWLEKNGFPYAPIYQVQPNMTKVDIAKEQKLDVFVDDKFKTFQEMTKNGILCWLFDASHNKKYNVGHKRIFNLDNI